MDLEVDLFLDCTFLNRRPSPKLTQSNSRLHNPLDATQDEGLESRPLPQRAGGQEGHRLLGEPHSGSAQGDHRLPCLDRRDPGDVQLYYLHLPGQEPRLAGPVDRCQAKYITPLSSHTQSLDLRLV